jgi:hypothetical protein
MNLLTSFVVLVVALATGGVVWRLTGKRPRRREDGVTQFQRHLGALSPEARRSVVQRDRRD